MPTILLAIKKNYGIGMVGLLIFTPLLILFTGILNRFIFIPEWYPNQPTIFAPGQVMGRPPFSQYTFAGPHRHLSFPMLDLAYSSLCGGR